MNKKKIKEFNERRYSTRPLQSAITDLRIKALLRLSGTNSRILDIGCYDGSIAKLLKLRNNEVVGLDISEGAVRLARSNGVKSYVCNIEEEPFPSTIGKFNTVVAGEIIEHIFDPDALLKKIYSVLVPGGHLILTTPNLAGLGSRMSLLLGRLPWMVENDLLPGRSGHIRYFTYLEIVKLLNRQGFKVTNFTTDSVGINNITIPLLDKLFPTFGRILIVKAIRL